MCSTLSCKTKSWDLAIFLSKYAREGSIFLLQSMYSYYIESSFPTPTHVFPSYSNFDQFKPTFSNQICITYPKFKGVSVRDYLRPSYKGVT